MDRSIKARELASAVRQGERVVAVHYACESFYEVGDRPVAISCVGFEELGQSSNAVFSITDFATDNEDEAEVQTLERAYSWLRERSDALIVHWNMSSSEFGFSALELRYGYLTGKDRAPYVVPQDKLYDLDDLIESRHGTAYAPHPKLRSTASMNDVSLRHFLSGGEEAEAYKQGEHGQLKRSVAQKVRVVTRLTRLFAEGRLQSAVSGPNLQFADEYVDSVKAVLQLGRRMRYVERQIKQRHSDRPTIEINDEYDAQDLFHSLLRLLFDDVRAEDYTPSYAGGSSRVDFVLPRFGIAIELKHSRPSMTSAKLGEELLVDIGRYGDHRSVRHLICLVFDHEGHLVNPRGVEDDLSRTHADSGVSVTVAIIDR